MFVVAKKLGRIGEALVPQKHQPSARLQDANEFAPRPLAVEPVSGLRRRDEIHALMSQSGGFGGSRDAGELRKPNQQPFGRFVNEAAMIVNEKIKGDDLWLELPMKGDPMPAFRFLVDTQPLNKDATGRVLERGVRIQMLTGVKVPETRRAAVLRVINDFNRDKVFAAVYVDSDEEIMLDWTLNVLAPGLDTEYVYDVLARENKLWRELYPLVTAAMQ